MRGEYELVATPRWGWLELPPRARRIPPPNPRNTINRGTTSACAENTDRVSTITSLTWNYLRVRGEYSTPAPGKPAATELPPRARRIPAFRRAPIRSTGTTSACAENTIFYYTRLTVVWNYLRVRGEYVVGGGPYKNYRELPPRARRIQEVCDSRYTLEGTTSACAENTHQRARESLLLRNYLRVRGEYKP